MKLPTLQQHANGRWYVHWSVRRRTARASTGHEDARGAILYYADWLKLNANNLTPEPGSTRMLQTLLKLRRS